MDLLNPVTNAARYPRVVSAAMLMDDGLIVPGVRHYSPDMRITLKRIYGMGVMVLGIWIKKPYHMRVVEQGFIDTKGMFLSRKEAFVRAKQNNQIIVKTGAANSDELYSEDIY